MDIWMRCAKPTTRVVDLAEEVRVGRYLAALLLIVAVAGPALGHPPYGLVVDRKGDIYFSDLETVWRFSADGRMSVFRPGIPETHVHELALAPDGAIEGDQNRYDPATQRYYTGLWTRTRSGVERDIVPMTEHPPAGAGVLRDRDGNRYVTLWVSNEDQRMQVLKRRPNGSVDLLFDQTRGASPPVARTVAGVAGMTFASDGSLFFAARDTLWRRAKDGTVASVYSGGTVSSFRGLAASADVRVLVADMGSRTILEIGADGRAAKLFRESEPWLRTAVALSNGRLLVLEANANPYEYNDRVRLIEVKDGRGKLLASPGRPARATTPRPSLPKENGQSQLIYLGVLALGALGLPCWLLRARAR
jgi:hypothetical protein